MKHKKFIIIILLVVAAGVIYKYSVHPVVLKTLFPDKIWPHRVNSIAKLQETSEFFTGMELDVVWEGIYFDVNHPPAKSIQLYLKDYLEHIPDTGQYGLWIDYKNLTVDVASSSAEHIDIIFKKNNLDKNRIYIESPFPQYLTPFEERGYKVSYYLPSRLYQIENRDTLDYVLNRINLNLENKPELFISAPFADYSFIREHYPERKKLLWHLSGFNGPANKFKIYRALFDDKVEVVLLPFKSETGDR
jgi:hypothetical protein